MIAIAGKLQLWLSSAKACGNCCSTYDASLIPWAKPWSWKDPRGDIPNLPKTGGGVVCYPTPLHIFDIFSCRTTPLHIFCAFSTFFTPYSIPPLYTYFIFLYPRPLHIFLSILFNMLLSHPRPLHLFYIVSSFDALCYLHPNLF